MLDIVVPDEAVSYIVSRYFVNRQVEGVTTSLGVSQEVVEAVLELFLNWADQNGYIKNGALMIDSLDAS